MNEDEHLEADYEDRHTFYLEEEAENEPSDLDEEDPSEL